VFCLFDFPSTHWGGNNHPTRVGWCRWDVIRFLEAALEISRTPKEDVVGPLWTIFLEKEIQEQWQWQISSNNVNGLQLRRLSSVTRKFEGAKDRWFQFIHRICHPPPRCEGTGHWLPIVACFKTYATRKGPQVFCSAWYVRKKTKWFNIYVCRIWVFRYGIQTWQNSATLPRHYPAEPHLLLLKWLAKMWINEILKTRAFSSSCSQYAGVC